MTATLASKYRTPKFAAINSYRDSSAAPEASGNANNGMLVATSINADNPKLGQSTRLCSMFSPVPARSSRLVQRQDNGAANAALFDNFIRPGYVGQRHRMGDPVNERVRGERFVDVV